MNHCVAVWADWYKVINRVDYVIFADLAQWHDVMNVDKPYPKFSVLFPKIKPTNTTG